MKEYKNQEVREKMSWKGFASKLMQSDAHGLTTNERTVRKTPLALQHIKSSFISPNLKIQFLSIFWEIVGFDF